MLREHEAVEVVGTRRWEALKLHGGEGTSSAMERARVSSDEGRDSSEVK